MRLTTRVSPERRTGSLARMLALGAVPVDDEVVEFCVWAPDAKSVAVRVDGAEHGLERSPDGTWSREVSARAGADYVYVVDGVAWPDPCSRWQPEGVRGPSRVLATSAFEIAAGPDVRLTELVR